MSMKIFVYRNGHWNIQCKDPCRVRHLPVSPPYIDRRGCGVRLPVLAEHGGIESDSQPSYLSLAGDGARAGEDLSEQRSARILREGRAWRSSRSEGADHQDRRCVGKSPGRLLEVRAAVGCDLEAKLPAVDEKRTTETAGPDRSAFLAGGRGAAKAVADCGARHVASARSRRPHRTGLVYET